MNMKVETRGARSGAASLTNSLGIISGALYAELKRTATGLNAFGESPTSSPVSPALVRMHRAATFCGYWGVATYLGALRELAVGIETVPPSSVDRTEYLERVKTLASGINALGVHLREINGGIVSSYTSLNEQFAKVIRKARPKMLELAPEDTDAVMFMPVPPSLEIDAIWVPRHSASRAALLEALGTFVASDELSEHELQAVADCNPYRTLAGFFEGAACQPQTIAGGALEAMLREEYTRLLAAIGSEVPAVPPQLDAFLFSRLLYSLVTTDETNAALLQVLKRYQLVKQKGGKPPVSMHDVARKFISGMGKFRDVYAQAASSNSPNAVRRHVEEVVKGAHVLESSAFTTFAVALRELTTPWNTEEIDISGWLTGAAMVLMLQACAENWADTDAQEELNEVGNLMAAGAGVQVSITLQRATRIVAVQKACVALLLDSAEVKKHIETALRSTGEDTLTLPLATRFIENVGPRLKRFLSSASGFCALVSLPRAAAYAAVLEANLLTPEQWMTDETRHPMYDALTRLSVFIGRLRPNSLYDLEEDEIGVLGASQVLSVTNDIQPIAVIEPVVAIEPAASELAVEVEPVVEVAHVAEVATVADVAPAVRAAPENSDSTTVAEGFEVVPAESTRDEISSESPAISCGADVTMEDAMSVEVAAEELAPLAPSPEQEAVVLAVEPVAAEMAPAEVVEADVAVSEPIAVEPESLPVSSVVHDDAAAAPVAVDAPHVDDYDFFGEPGSSEPAARGPIDAEALLQGFLAAGEGFEDDVSVVRSDRALAAVMFEESEQCIADIGRQVERWMLGDESPESLVGSVADIRRYVHTLKGVARVAGLMKVGAVLHAVEDDLDLVPDDGVALENGLSAYVSVFGTVRDAMDNARSEYESGSMDEASAPVAPAAPADEIHAPELRPAAPAEVAPTAMRANESASSALAPVAAHEELSNSEVAAELEADDDSTPEAGLPAPEVTPVAAKPAAAPTSAVKALVAPIASPAAPSRTEASVRVSLKLAGKVGDSSSQVMMASRKSLEGVERSMRQLHDMVGNLKRMGPVLRELDIMASASIQSSSGDSSAQGFDALELDRFTSLQELVRRLREAYEDAVGSASILSEGLRVASGAEQETAKLSDDLQRESSELLLVGLTAQQARWARVVEKACEDTGKSATLVIDPKCRVPAAALDKMMPVFEHLLRNAVAHGIESPEGRRASGKPVTGTIVIGLPSVRNQDASVVQVAIHDDGSGIDHANVLAIARRKGLVLGDAKLSDEAIRELLFMPGFSTSTTKSQLAGRGVGLDVVRSAVSGLGGLVAVSSKLGKGADFLLTLPSDISSMHVVPVASRGYKCLLPLTLVVRIVPVSGSSGVVLNEGEGKVTIGNAEYPLIDLGTRVLAADAIGAVRHGRGHLVLMRESEVTTAVLVDSVGTQSRMVVRALPPFVRDVPGMVAGTLSADGEVGLVMNPLRLQELAKAPQRVVVEKTAPHIMVVDDSSTVRMVTARFLKRLGYVATTASDGLEALQQISRGAVPDGFLFDLEMPGMGGFELIAEIRSKAEFKNTPIVIISSRSQDKHRERARELGATAYLVKPYEDSELSSVLESLVGSPVE